MKKLALLFALVLTLSLTACGNSEQPTVTSALHESQAKLLSLLLQRAKHQTVQLMKLVIRMLKYGQIVLVRPGFRLLLK